MNSIYYSRNSIVQKEIKPDKIVITKFFDKIPIKKAIDIAIDKVVTPEGIFKLYKMRTSRENKKNLNKNEGIPKTEKDKSSGHNTIVEYDGFFFL